MTKFASILSAAMLVIGLVPTGNAVCNNGEIGLGSTDEFFVNEFFIYANSCNSISSDGRLNNICGSYGDSTVNCDSNGSPTTVQLGDGSSWASCYGTTQTCGTTTIDYCCVRQ